MKIFKKWTKLDNRGESSAEFLLLLILVVMVSILSTIFFTALFDSIEVHAAEPETTPETKSYHVHTMYNYSDGYVIDDFTFTLTGEQVVVGYKWSEDEYSATYMFYLIDDDFSLGGSHWINRNCAPSKLVRTTYKASDDKILTNENTHITIAWTHTDILINMFKNNAPEFGSEFNLKVSDMSTILCDVPLFDNVDALENYLTTGDDSGQINKPEINLEVDGVFNPDIDIPKLAVDSIGYNFSFVNGADNLYFEMKGRWYSVDDIELYKENLMWKYKYDTLLKGSLGTWVMANDRLLSTGNYNFAELGAGSFDRFINRSYPIDNRTYTGGTNTLGNWLGGYNDALSQLKLLLKEPTSIYNGVEIYVRFYYFDDNNKPVYSKWTHYYNNLANSSGSSGTTWDDKDNMFTENQSQNGLSDTELDELENTGNSRLDVDSVSNYNNYTNYFDKSEGLVNATFDVFNLIKSLVVGMGDFPTLVNQVFGFLPYWLINLIAISLAAIVVMRFVGR